MDEILSSTYNEDVKLFQEQPTPVSLQAKPLLQRQEEEEEVQAKPINSVQGAAEKGVPKVDPEMEGKINAVRGSGEILPDHIRSTMEQSFGADFNGVRVHADSNADALSQSLQARAFTTGQDIFFKSGEYNPASSSGQRLLAHELTHTIQQGGGGTPATPVPGDGKNTLVQDRGSPTGMIERGLVEKGKKYHEEEAERRKKHAEQWKHLEEMKKRGFQPEEEKEPEAKEEEKKEEVEEEVKEEEKKAEVKAPEEKKTEVKAPEQKKLEEPYEFKPSEGFSTGAYVNALEKFKPMKKPRLLGGPKKSDRRTEAMNYLKETVEASKEYNLNPQKVVNSIMEAYRDTFGEELKEGAPEKLGVKEKLKLMGQKIKEFVKNVFSIKWWVGKLSELKEIVVDFPTGITSHIADSMKILGEFQGTIKALANTIGPYIRWLPIVGLVSSIIDIVKGIPSTISKGKDMIALGKAAVAAQKKEEPSAALLAEAAEYGFYKVMRGFANRFLDLTIAVANFVLSVLGVIGGFFSAGIALVITTGLSIGLSLVSLGKAAFAKLKGFWKWITGKRGKARLENAKKIVIAAREGSHEALNLILKLDLSGIAGGNELKQFWYYLRSWVAKGGEQNKQILVDMLKGWDEKVIDTLVKGVAEKLKSQ